MRSMQKLAVLQLPHPSGTRWITYNAKTDALIGTDTGVARKYVDHMANTNRTR
jgi:hypothetical protein